MIHVRTQKLQQIAEEIFDGCTVTVEEDDITYPDIDVTISNSWGMLMLGEIQKFAGNVSKRPQEITISGGISGKDVDISIYKRYMKETLVWDDETSDEQE